MMQIIDFQTLINYIIAILIFPGLLFAFFFGALFYWEFRKLRARFQSRVGPPWYQLFADIIKLFAKETIIPALSNRFLFIMTPIVAVASALTILWLLQIPVAILPPILTINVLSLSFYGDLIVILYLLIVIETAEIIAGFSSASPYGIIGSSRKVNLVIAYELPFAIALLTVAFHMSSLRLSDIVQWQLTFGPFILEIPQKTFTIPELAYLAPIFHVLTFIAFLACLLPKLRIKPFDMPEAEAEIIAGSLTEYSGRLLGLFELAQVFKWFILPALTVILFFGGDISIITFLIKCAIIVAIIAVIESINPRYRIDQGYKFYFKYVLPIAVIGFFGEALLMFM